ncbi:hypothetical protein ACFWAD_23480 [Rhodococcus sp. NPDC059969]|uniref:hypothetical protein n=1 Tax=Rhodococcus sp. NPDC059969 TaxID=3347018 RepID=UPI00366C2EAA
MRRPKSLGEWLDPLLVSAATLLILIVVALVWMMPPATFLDKERRVRDHRDWSPGAA